MVKGYVVVIINIYIKLKSIDMGCAGSQQTFEDWEIETERLEADVLRASGWKDEEYIAKYTNIVMDEKPFKVRTFYFGCEDKSKKTLVMTHGFMGNMISWFGFLNLIAAEYRVICFDNANWGLNTRSEDSEACRDGDSAEKWLLSFWEQTINGLDDCPDRFFLSGHSHGGFQCSLFASHFPERVEKLFLISPAGTSPYIEETYDPYNYMNM